MDSRAPSWPEREVDPPERPARSDDAELLLAMVRAAALSDPIVLAASGERVEKVWRVGAAPTVLTAAATISASGADWAADQKTPCAAL